MRYQRTNIKPLLENKYAEIQRLSPTCLLVKRDREDPYEVWRIALKSDNRYVVVNRRPSPYGSSGQLATNAQGGLGRTLPHIHFSRADYNENPNVSTRKVDILNRNCKPIVTLNNWVRGEVQAFEIGERLVVNNLREGGLPVARIYNLDGQQVGPSLPPAETFAYVTNRNVTPAILVLDTGLRTPEGKSLYAPFDSETGLPRLDETVMGWEAIGLNRGVPTLWKVHYKTERGIRYGLVSPDGEIDTGGLYKALRKTKDPQRLSLWAKSYFVAQQEDGRWISFLAALPEFQREGGWRIESKVTAPQASADAVLAEHYRQMQQQREDARQRALAEAKARERKRQSDIARFDNEFAKGPQQWNPYTVYRLARSLGGTYIVRHLDRVVESGKKDPWVNTEYLQWAYKAIKSHSEVTREQADRVYGYYNDYQLAMQFQLMKQQRDHFEAQVREAMGKAGIPLGEQDEYLSKWQTLGQDEVIDRMNQVLEGWYQEQARRERMAAAAYRKREAASFFSHDPNANGYTPRGGEGYRDIYAESDARAAATRRYTETLQRYTYGQQDWRYVR